ncbi:MAG: 1-deoxy-D-xylulose-5-phosphate reductoisomerase [Rikenellaceae bacterium]
MKTRLAILGSTGSIGTQTLEVVRSYPTLFGVEVLSAANNWELLASQAIEFNVPHIVIANDLHYGKLREALSGRDTVIHCGVDSLEEVVGNKAVDTVVIAVVGFAGLAPTIAAIKARKRIALANKESLVVGGDIVMPLAKEYGVDIMPIDSEHSAIFQCLVGEVTPLKRILLTASGGSLRDYPLSELKNVTPKEVLCHPVWDMGQRITVDSATMLNKGFEVIEAAHLFGVGADKIQVVIHPQSIIHSAVEFEDNCIKAQISYPDMRLAIQYALTYPERMAVSGLQSFDPFITSSLTFMKPDTERYPCLGLAISALEQGGLAPTVLNAAGEVAVEAFLRSEIKFTDITAVISECLLNHNNNKLTNINEIFETDAETRYKAGEVIGRL